MLDLERLLRSGIEVDGKTYNLNVGPVICDAPARALAKNIVNFNATYGCDQCTSCGVYDGKRMTYPQTHGIQLRTDESFRLRQHPRHHRSGAHSVFEKLPLDMVSSFPVDFMHQAGGTMRKIISWNVEGPRMAGSGRLMCRMTRANVKICNNRLTAIQSQIPNTFARKCR